MSEFEFEELLADMFDISDSDRESSECVIETTIFEKFGVDFDSAFAFTLELLNHVPVIQTGLTGKKYRAFVSKNKPVMLMRKEVEEQIK